MYDPTVGRWLSLDPIGFEGNDTNLYRYVGNEPITSIDYWGLAKRNLKDIHASVVFMSESSNNPALKTLALQAFEKIKKAYEILVQDKEKASCCIHKYYSMAFSSKGGLSKEDLENEYNKAYGYLRRQMLRIILQCEEIRISFSKEPKENSPDVYASVDTAVDIPKRTITVYRAFFDGYDIINGQKTNRSEKTEIDTFIHEFHHYALKKTGDYFTYESAYKKFGHKVDGMLIYPKDEIYKYIAADDWEKERKFPVKYQYRNAYTFERFVNCLLEKN